MAFAETQPIIQHRYTGVKRILVPGNTGGLHEAPALFSAAGLPGVAATILPFADPYPKIGGNVLYFGARRNRLPEIGGELSN